MAVPLGSHLQLQSSLELPHRYEGKNRKSILALSLNRDFQHFPGDGILKNSQKAHGHKNGYENSWSTNLVTFRKHDAEPAHFAVGWKYYSHPSWWLPTFVCTITVVVVLVGSSAIASTSSRLFSPLIALPAGARCYPYYALLLNWKNDGNRWRRRSFWYVSEVVRKTAVLIYGNRMTLAIRAVERASTPEPPSIRGPYTSNIKINCVYYTRCTNMLLAIH